ncbi:MAG: DUF192 domain-containing protein [Cyanobacteria bacterium J06626_18]
MWRKIGLFVVLGTGALGAGLVFAAPHRSDFIPTVAQRLPVSAEAVIDGRTIELEVARTAEEQATGLMFREELPAYRGMLFELPRPRSQILWTKDVNFPIDAVFLRDGRVQVVIAELMPCPNEPCPVYGSSEPVDQVLELRGGRAAELGLVPGKRVTIQPVAGRS